MTHTLHAIVTLLRKGISNETTTEHITKRSVEATLYRGITSIRRHKQSLSKYLLVRVKGTYADEYALDEYVL